MNFKAEIIKEFKVNKYITLKLTKEGTTIYVKNKPLRMCSKLALINPYDEGYFQSAEDIPSTYENISLEDEFWGHCSNLQVWAENNYDSSLLHATLALVLLDKLYKLNDPVAVQVYSKEISKFIQKADYYLKDYLRKQGYFSYLSSEEIVASSLCEEEAMVMKEIVNSSPKKYILIPNFDIDDFRRGYLTQNYHFSTKDGHVIELELEINYQNPMFPKGLSKLQKLSSLYLYMYNTGEKIPDLDCKIISLWDLKILTAGEVIIPNKFTSFPNLHNLYIQGPRRGEVPFFEDAAETLGTLKDLKYLTINNTLLNTVPSSIGDLQSLEALDLDSNNNLENIPDSIGQLASLERLSFNRCNLKRIPNSIGDLKSLRKLNLESNRLKTLPSTIGNITTLSFIDLSYNFPLKTLPLSLKNLKDIHVSCDQCYNLTTELGDEIKISGFKDFEVHDSGVIIINLIVKEKGDAPAFAYSHYKDQLVNPHTIVIEDEVISVVFNYNDLHKFDLILKNKGGFTRLNLYERISEAHAQLYENEMKNTYYEVFDYIISMVYFKPERNIWIISFHSTY